MSQQRTRRGAGSTASDHLGSTLLAIGTIGAVGLTTVLVLAVRGGSLSFSVLGATLAADVNAPQNG